MNADAELHRWVGDWAQAWGDLTPRPMFGCPAWFRGGKVRVCVIANTVTVKSTPELIAAAKDQCTFADDFLAHGRSMGKGWVSFTPPDRGEATMAEVRRWLETLVSS